MLAGAALDDGPGMLDVGSGEEEVEACRGGFWTAGGEALDWEGAGPSRLKKSS